MHFLWIIVHKKLTRLNWYCGGVNAKVSLLCTSKLLKILKLLYIAEKSILIYFRLPTYYTMYFGYGGEMIKYGNKFSCFFFSL